jgi:uncharacterized protein (DUF488 family)
MIGQHQLSNQIKLCSTIDRILTVKKNKKNWPRQQNTLVFGCLRRFGAKYQLARLLQEIHISETGNPAAPRHCPPSNV